MSSKEIGPYDKIDHIGQIFASEVKSADSDELVFDQPPGWIWNCRTNALSLNGQFRDTVPPDQVLQRVMDLHNQGVDNLKDSEAAWREFYDAHPTVPKPEWWKS